MYRFHFSPLIEQKALCPRNAFWRGFASENGVCEVKVEFDGWGITHPTGEAKLRVAAKRNMGIPGESTLTERGAESPYREVSDK